MGADADARDIASIEMIVGKECDRLLEEQGFERVTIGDDSVLYRNAEGAEITAKGPASKGPQFTYVVPNYSGPPFVISGYKSLMQLIGKRTGQEKGVVTRIPLV